MPPESSFDLHAFPAHHLLLTTFLIPHTAGDLPPAIDWPLLLREPASTAIGRLVSAGLLAPAPLAVQLDHKFTAEALKDLLRARSLPLSGNKPDLVLRLIQSDPQGMQLLISGDLLVLQCTDAGCRLAEEYFYQGIDPISQRLNLSSEKVIQIFDWILLAAAAGIIGDIAYDLLKNLAGIMQEYLLKKKEETAPSTPTPAPPISSSIQQTTAYNYYWTGRENMEKGDYPNALAEYDQAIAIDPKYTDAYHSRGIAYEALGDYSRALAEYDQAIALNPQYDVAYIGRGNIHRLLGDYSRAIPEYDRAIALNPNEAIAYNNRGFVYHELGDYSRALADFDQAIALDPGYAFAYNNRGVVHKELGDYSRALADYDQAIAHDLKNAPIFNNRGIIHKELGDYSRALADFDQAIAFDPKYAEAYFNRGLLYSNRGNFPRALSDFASALDLTNDLNMVLNIKREQARIGRLIKKKK